MMKIIMLVMLVLLVSVSTMGKTIGITQGAGVLASRAVQTMKKVDWNSLNNQAQNGQLFYEKLKKGYNFYKKLRDETLKKREALNVDKSTDESLQEIRGEILTCAPIDKKKICYSPCQKAGYNYMWCYNSSEKRQSQYSMCSCEVRKSILEYLDLTKRQLLEPNAKPLTVLELALLVTTSLLGAMGLVTGVTVAIMYWRNRDDFPNQPNFIPNPIYAGAGIGAGHGPGNQ